MNLRIKNKYILAIATVVILCTLFIRNCNNEVSTVEFTYDPALQYEYETVRDTVTTVVTQTKIDTIVIEIEETINNIMDKTETIVKEVVRERDSMVVRIVELEQVTNITVYDTIKVYVPIQPDSVTIYNVWEYETFDGKVTRSTRDTVQSNTVYRHYAQKYIMK
jgi:DNA primase catalytic subunit